MKKGKSILTRCLALALALVLIVSGANLGAALKVSANNETVVTVGELVAKNYELAEWEVALLNTGFFGKEYSYTTPGTDDDLVAIDNDTKTITAKNYGQWVPVSADIMVNNVAEETVNVVDNKATYAYDGETFSVSVKYELNYEVSAAEQDKILNTSAYLLQGLENVKAVYEADGNMDIIEQALPTLESLSGRNINGVTFGPEFVAAVKAIREDMDANGGKMSLRYINENEYKAGTEYLVQSIGTYEVKVSELYNNLVAIAEDKLTQAPSVEDYLYWNDELDGTNNLTMWKTFKNVLNILIEQLEPVAKADWHTAEILAVNVSGAEFAQLDALLANAGEPTKVNYKTALKEAETVVHATLNMHSVIVSVELKVVGDEADSAELVSYGKPGRAFLTLPQGATAAQIEAAIAESGVYEAAKADWGSAFDAEHYVASAAELPEKLTEDLVYIVTYAPKSYTVNAYGTEQSYPYGYKLTLPIHEDASKFAYDYTVNGKAYMQGEVITIEGNTEIERTEGKAYHITTVYAAIGSSLGNDTAKAILSSGALKGNELVYYRAPEAPEMKLLDKVLTVEAAIASDYKGLSWAPYSYSNNDTTGYFTGNVVNGYIQRQAQVDYILKLTNVSADKASDVLAVAEAIYAEAAMQTEGMDYLLSKYDDIGTLNKTYLNGLLGTIMGFDFTPEDGNANDAKNQELVAFFSNIVKALLAGHMDTSNLTLHTMLTEYKNGGLAYYYKNSAAIYHEVDALAGYLTDLVGDPEKEAALALLLNELGQGALVEKIANLGRAMNDTKENLVPTNAAIDTSKDLKALVNAVSAETAPETLGEGNPYILSSKFTVVDESAVVLIANIYVDGEYTTTISTTEYDRGAVLTYMMLDDLAVKIDHEMMKLGEKLPYYTTSGSAYDLSDKVGAEMTDNLSVDIHFNAKKYTVTIDGANAQVITINDLTIDLPQHEKHPNTVYEYTVKGEVTRATNWTFTAEDLTALFANGTYNITSETLDVGQQMMNGAIAALNNNTVGNTYEIVDGTLIANVNATADGLMAFVTGLMDTGYGYIGINGYDLMYAVEGEGLKVSIQALINAVFEDEQFSRDALITLGKNGEGEILHANLQLGVDSAVLYEQAMPFVLNLTSVPEQMATVAKGLEAGKNNFNFYSNGDHVFVYVNLPEKVYEVYLTAMWGIGELDKTDLNVIDNKIAMQFLYDYIDLIANTDVTATTFENTLRMLDKGANDVLDKDIPDYDIAAYNKYLEMVKKVLNSDGLVIEPDEEADNMFISVSGQGAYLKEALDRLGVDIGIYENMIAEFGEGEILHGKVITKLANTDVDFEALVIDLNAGIDGVKELAKIRNSADAKAEAVDLVQGEGLANFIDYTTDLSSKLAGAGKSAVMLLDDIDGDVVINDITILDLNGKTINGNLIANDNVLIIDSTLDTANAGSITGTVSGKVIILAGNYNANVAAYLPDGYLQVNGNVRNALYTIESPNRGDLIVTINPDFYMSDAVNGYLPNVAALSGDLMVDLYFNYYLSSMLSVDGNNLFNIDFDDVVGIIGSDTKASDIINELLCMFDAKGTSAVYNTISADLLDFAAIEQALLNGTKIVSYDLTVAPYGVEIEHITDGDYLTVNLGSVESHAWTFEIALKMDCGVNSARMAKFFGDLNSIVVAEKTYSVIDLEQPYYADRTLWLEGSTKHSLALDLSKNPAFQTAIAVFLAYGNPDKADDYVNAIGDQAALKALFNDTSVADFVKSLKAMQLGVDFAEMAASVGVTVDISDVSEYELVIRLIAVSVGEVLDVLDITGWTDKTMGMIEEGNSGVYSLGFDADGYADATVRGFTVDVAGVIEHVLFSVKIFGEDEEDCLWGDANHDGLVNGDDATLILLYELGIAPEGFCTKRTDVNGDGVIGGDDATMVLWYELGTITEFPAEKN